LAPAPDGGDDLCGIGDPLERLCLRDVVSEEAIERSLEINYFEFIAATNRFFKPSFWIVDG
jgi:hypothetical protein